MDSDGFTTKELLEITGVDPNVLRTWLNARRIVPDIRADVGRGRSRLFSRRNLFEVSIARELHLFGLSGARISEVVEQFRILDNPMMKVFSGEEGVEGHIHQVPRNAFLLFRPMASPETSFRFEIGEIRNAFDWFDLTRETITPAWLVVDLARLASQLEAKLSERQSS